MPSLYNIYRLISSRKKYCRPIAIGFTGMIHFHPRGTLTFDDVCLLRALMSFRHANTQASCCIRLNTHRQRRHGYCHGSHTGVASPTGRRSSLNEITIEQQAESRQGERSTAATIRRSVTMSGRKLSDARR
jgi:hypothetical protein